MFSSVLLPNTNFVSLVINSVALFPLTFSSIQFLLTVLPLLYPCNEVVGGYTGFTMSVRPSVDKSYVVTGEERRIPFIFDNFHFCHSRVIGLDMTENRIFTLCRMITWVVFLRMFWNLSSSLLMKREGSLSFLMIFTFIVPELGALYFIQCHRKI